MRVRERGYIAGLSVLDEADVLKAVGSVQRMSVGMELEERVKREGRRWSIRDEIAVGTPRVEEVGEGEGEGGEEGDDGLPPLPECLELPLSPITPVSPFTPTPTCDSLSPKSELLAPSIPSYDGLAPSMSSHNALVEASHAARNETNKRHRELERKEEEVRVGRARYEEAKELAERLMGEVTRGEKGLGGGWGFKGRYEEEV